MGLNPSATNNFSLRPLVLPTYVGLNLLVLPVVCYGYRFTHLRGFESQIPPDFGAMMCVLPTYVGLNLSGRKISHRFLTVLPTYVGLNLQDKIYWIPRPLVLPTYVGLNPKTWRGG